LHDRATEYKARPVPTTPEELESLRASEARFRAIVSIASDAIISTDAQQRVIHFNRGAEEIFGYTADEVIGQPLNLLIPDRYRRAHEEHVRRFATSNISARRMGERAEISGIRKNGEEFPAEASISRVEIDGELVFTAVLRDITERRRSEARLKFLAKASELLASSLDVEKTLESVAALAVPVLGDWCAIYLGGDGRPVRRVHAVHNNPALHADDMARYVEIPFTMREAHPVTQVLRSGRSMIVELSPARLREIADNEDHCELLTRLDAGSALVAPLKARERTMGAVSFFLDASGSRHYSQEDLLLAEELAGRAALALDNARLYAEARSAIQARDDLLAVVSHDLGNPLSAIRLGTTLLLRQVPSEEAEAGAWKHLENIRTAVSQMERLITDLLEMKRIEAGYLALEKERCSVTSLLDEAIDAFAEIAAGKNITLLKLPSDAAVIEADRTRLQQVFSNLIGNAIKFTPSGGTIEVGATAHDSEVVFAVRDTGSGIPPEHLSHVFDRFWQARRAERHGIGLGLAIVKGIIEAHGGRVWVESEVGRGSSFYFTVPRSNPAR